MRSTRSTSRVALGSRSLPARAAGALAYALQDVDATAARRAAAEVLEIADAGDFHLNMPHRVLAILAWRAGDGSTASGMPAESARFIREQGDRYVQAASMHQLAALVGTVDPYGAAGLLGIADALLPEMRVTARDERNGHALRRDLEAVLGRDELDVAIARGRRLDTRAANRRRRPGHRPHCPRALLAPPHLQRFFMTRRRRFMNLVE